MSVGKRTAADDVTAEACRLYCEAKRSKVLQLSSMPEAELQLELQRKWACISEERRAKYVDAALDTLAEKRHATVNATASPDHVQPKPAEHARGPDDPDDKKWAHITSYLAEYDKPFGLSSFYSRDEGKKKKLEAVMAMAECSRERALELLERYAREAEDKRQASERASQAAMAARPHESGTIWAIEESPYCRYDDNMRPKLHSVHLTEQAATSRAKEWWTMDTCGVDNFNMNSKPDELYSATACVEVGAGVMTISVKRVPINELKKRMLQKALQQRGARTDGSIPELRARLSDLVG